MAYQARVSYTANGSTDTFSFSFSYIASSHVKAYVDGVEDTSITFPTTSSVQLSSTPSNGAIVLIKRVTPIDTRLVDFQDGSVLSATDLDKSADQNFFVAQETSDEAQSHLEISDATNQYDAGASGSNLRITNVANPTSDQDVATKHYLENTWLSASDKADINTLAPQASKIALLGTADAIADMNTLATADVISDLNTLANSDIVADLNTLAASDIITDMNTLATAANVTAMGLLGNATTVTNMGLLGTADAVADINTLATADVVSDLNTLATGANVTAMGLLGNATTVTNMGLLGVAGVITDMGILGTADVVADMNTLATADVVADMNTLGTADVVADMNTLGTADNVANMNTVADNLASVNSFANTYRISSSAPVSSLDVGDLYFDTTANELKVYKSSGWAAAGSTVNGTSQRYEYIATANQTTFTGADENSNVLAYDSPFVDTYLNGVRLINGTDITVSSGTSVVLATGASVGDRLSIVAYGTFNVAAVAASAITSGILATTRGGTGLGSLGTAGQALTVNSGASALEFSTIQASDITTVGTFFSNWNTISENLTSTLVTTKNAFLKGAITVADTYTWTITGDGELSIL